MSSFWSEGVCVNLSRGKPSHSIGKTQTYKEGNLSKSQLTRNLQLPYVIQFLCSDDDFRNMNSQWCLVVRLLLVRSAVLNSCSFLGRKWLFTSTTKYRAQKMEAIHSQRGTATSRCWLPRVKARSVAPLICTWRR